MYLYSARFENREDNKRCFGNEENGFLLNAKGSAEAYELFCKLMSLDVETSSQKVRIKRLYVEFLPDIYKK